MISRVQLEISRMGPRRLNRLAPPSLWRTILGTMPTSTSTRVPKGENPYDMLPKGVFHLHFSECCAETQLF